MTILTRPAGVTILTRVTNLAGVAAGPGGAFGDTLGEHALDDLAQGRSRGHDRTVGQVVDLDTTFTTVAGVLDSRLVGGDIGGKMSQDDAVRLILTSCTAFDGLVEMSAAVSLGDIDHGNETAVGLLIRDGIIGGGDVGTPAPLVQGQVSPLALDRLAFMHRRRCAG